MAFPVVESTATTGRTAAETTSPVSYPAAVSAGALLVCIARVAVAGAIGWPAGWTELVEDSSDASDDVTAIAYKTAIGNEGGTTFDVTHGSGKSAYIVYSITGAKNPATQPPQISTVAVGTSTTPNPTSLTPTGGAQDYLWLWLGGWEGEQTSPPAGNPANYTNPLGASTAAAGAVTVNCRVASAQRNLNAVSEDPPLWTISASDDWSAWTMAVHPAPPTQTISNAGAIATQEAYGTAKLNLEVVPSGIATSEVFGNPLLITTQTISNAGAIATLEAFGTSKLNLSLAPSGIAAQEGFGNSKVNLSLAPSGIATSEALGSAKLILYLSPSSIQSLETWGSPTILTGAQFLQPSSIVSEEAFGDPLLNLTLVPAGIPSQEAFGTAKLSLYLLPVGITSQEASGSPTLILSLAPSGIASAEAFGGPKINFYLTVNAMATGEAFGTPILKLLAIPLGIVSSEAFGNAVVVSGGQIIKAGSILSGELFGTSVVMIYIDPEEMARKLAEAKRKMFGRQAASGKVVILVAGPLKISSFSPKVEVKRRS